MLMILFSSENGGFEKSNRGIRCILYVDIKPVPLLMDINNEDNQLDLVRFSGNKLCLYHGNASNKDGFDKPPKEVTLSSEYVTDFENNR